MTLKIAINGFGRIGRLVARALHEYDIQDIELVLINSPGKIETSAHLLRYDSVHGRFSSKVTEGDDWIDFGRGRVKMTHERDPSQVPWDMADIVMECTGLFRSREKCQPHFDGGAKAILISAPGEDVDQTVVYGVNHGTLTKDDHVVSNGSCTTNALAPLAKVLNDAFGIENGFMTTVHAYTGDQPTLDTIHRKDYNRGRAAALSMIPTSTGAARAIGLVIPELNGKLDGKAIRVPTPNVSVVDLNVNLAKSASVEAINDAFRAAASADLKGVLQIIDDPTVSIDFNHDPHSSSLMTEETVVMDGKLARVLSWYDNEWGFSNRMLDTAAEMAKFL